jgi:DNA repair protein RadC
MTKKKIKLPELKVVVKRVNKDYDKFRIANPDDVFEFAKLIFDSDTMLWKEEFMLICLSTSNEVIGCIRLSSGGVRGTIVDPKWIFSTALGCGASSIMLIHNHPSGTLKASNEDINMTAKIVEIGRLMEMPLLDHIIIGGEFDGYLSMANEELM